MKRNDWILIGFICILTLFCFVGSFFVGKQEAGQVVVKVAGTLKGSYSLKEEQKIAIDDTNVFEIKDGEVKMISATCPDQHCVHQKAISKNGESIICLPNKVVVEIQSDEQSTLDAIAK